ncbi:MAG TPA: peptidoglycan-binding domain-containing protein [Chthoniobacterales bacterium]|nr:peptidoglycan-binding domain-containing protein [Chthoniobacterales bacterium]
MKKLMFSSLVIIALTGAIEPAQAARRDTNEGVYLPANSAYDSHGRNRIVRNVQKALREDGYYVGDTEGNFCFETRAAVRRYRRDHGLPIVGKIDEEFLRVLGF